MGNFYLIIGLFFAAMVLRRMGFIKSQHVALLTDFVVRVSLPCLSIVTLSRAEFGAEHMTPALVAWAAILVGAALALWIGKRAHLPLPTLKSFILVSAFPNTGFLGYPISYALFGSAGLGYAVVYDQIGMFPLFLTLGFVVAGGTEGLRRVFLFPPFLGVIAGLALNVLDVRLPGFVLTLLSGIGWTTLPLTILLIGAKITFKPSASWRDVSLILAIRMVIVPVIVYTFFSIAGISGLPATVSILESAMPPALSTSILAVDKKLDEDLAVTAIGTGTLLFILGLTLFMALR